MIENLIIVPYKNWVYFYKHDGSYVHKIRNIFGDKIEYRFDSNKIIHTNAYIKYNRLYVTKTYSNNSKEYSYKLLK